MSEYLRKGYEEHITQMAFDEMADGEHAIGRYVRKERIRNEYTFEDYKRDWGDDDE